MLFNPWLEEPTRSYSSERGANLDRRGWKVSGRSLTRPLWVVLASVCVLGAVVGCSSEPEPEPEPIRDEPPYVCMVIPKRAPNLVYGNHIVYGEYVYNDPEVDTLDIDEFHCQTHTEANPRAESLNDDIVYFQFRDTRASKLITRIRKNTKYMKPTSAVVGEARVEQEFESGAAWVYWRCGGHHILSEIQYVSEPDPERDYRKDLTTLLKIAQRRYAELNRCTPAPPSSSDEAGSELW